MSSAVLSADDLFDVTHKVRPSAQARELERLKIPFKVRSDRTLLVLWQDVRSEEHDRPSARPEPRVRLDA